MADKKISQLTALAAANLAPSTDVLAIVDTSATETKKIVAQDLINGVLNVASAVGIGTASPGYKLDVVGTTRVAETAAQNGYEVAPGATNIITSYNRTTSTWLPLRQRANKHEFYCDGVETLTLTSSGNLGLGVTPSAWNASFKAIQAGRSASFFGRDNATYEQAGMYSNAVFDATDNRWEYIIDNSGAGLPATAYLQSGGTHAWSVAASGTAGNAISFTQAMTLDASGNLGLGTTSPNISGGASGSQVFTVSASTSARNALIELKGTRTSADQVSSYIRSFSNSGATPGVDLQFYRGATDTDGFLTISTSGTERGRFTAGGYFKASDSGTYRGSGSAYHEFNQSINGDVLVVNATNTSYASNALAVTVTRNTTNNSFYAIAYYNDGAGAYKFRVADSGDVTNTNGTYGTISDAKMKTDIVDAGSQWDDIKAVRFRKFKMKNDPSGLMQLGVVAQELEQTSPGLVDEHADRDAEGNDLGTTTKSVKTSILLMKAAKALQEAMARIEQLEADMAALKASA